MLMGQKRKIIKASTVPVSLNVFCRDQLRELSQHYEVVAVSSPGEDLDEVARREGVRTVSVSMQRHIAPMSDLVSLMRLIACFRREKPWMVHSMTPKAGLLCMMAAWVARVPRRVHTFTGLVWPTQRGAKRLLLKTMDRLLCACATHIVPEGQGVKRDIENGRITSKPMRVLANGNVRGIDLEHYSLSPQIKAEAERLRCADKLTFVFVGRLVADKGINELVEAFDIVSRNRNDVRLVLVGGQETMLDPLADKTLATIEANENIVAVGQQSDVRPWLAAADVFVFPSYREGFPNVVIEAGAMGLPSIVTDINGSNEIVVVDQNGLIVPPRQVEPLVQAMTTLADDSKMRQAMASRARKMVADRYDCTLVRQALYDFYASIGD